jgi:hypothetical protein
MEPVKIERLSSLTSKIAAANEESTIVLAEGGMKWNWMR